MTTIGFLLAPEPSAEATQLFDDDIAELGFVMNASRLWAYQPGTVNRLFELMKVALSGAGLSLRERGILVTACASTFGDSYCSLAWGSKLAKWADAETAAAVLSGGDGPLSDPERALADWARKVARHPNGIAPADVQALRDAGFQDFRSSRSRPTWPSGSPSPPSTTHSAHDRTCSSAPPSPPRCSTPSPGAAPSRSRWSRRG